MYDRLKARIHDQGYSLKTMANAIGRSAPYLTARFQGRQTFDTADMWKMGDLLDIEPSVLCYYFPADGKDKAIPTPETRVNPEALKYEILQGFMEYMKGVAV